MKKAVGSFPTAFLFQKRYILNYFSSCIVLRLGYQQLKYVVSYSEIIAINLQTGKATLDIRPPPLKRGIVL